jgi:hypothetical protein
MKHFVPRDPKRVPKPKYEATALHARLTIGYPNSTTGSMDNREILLTGEATDGAGSKPTPPPITPRLEPRLTAKEKQTYQHDN